MARGVFRSLHRLFQHSSLGVRRKFEVCRAVVLSKLLYGLESVVLRDHDISKLNGFHAACCRKLLRISPSFISRVSNKYVLQQFKTNSLHSILLQRQLLFFGSIARRPQDDIVRQFVFKPNTFDSIEQHSPRKQGRPRKNWIREMFKHGQSIADGESFSDLISNELTWRSCVSSFCSN